MGTGLRGFPLLGLNPAPAPQVFHDAILLPMMYFVLYVCFAVYHHFFFPPFSFSLHTSLQELPPALRPPSCSKTHLPHTLSMVSLKVI